MTETLASLLARPASAISSEFINSVLEQGLRESLTLELKEKPGRTLLESIAAMANSYGGLVLVGISNDGEVTGVSDDVETDVVNLCFTKLEPPVVPDMALVAGVGPDGATVLAIRVDPGRLPVPIVLDGKVLVRLQGRNARADRARIRELFTTPAQTGPRAGDGPQSSPSRWFAPDRMGEIPSFVVRVALRVRTGSTRLPPIDTELRRALQERLAKSSVMKWRADKLRHADRRSTHEWVVKGVNSSTLASVILDAPQGDGLVPTFRAILGLPDTASYASCLFLFDSIQQEEVVARPVDEFIELTTLMIHEVVTENALPMLQDILGTGLWVEGFAELRMECTRSTFADWLDLSRFERLEDAHDSRESNSLVLTGFDLERGVVRPLVVDWFKRLLLDLGYYAFEDALERWRL